MFLISLFLVSLLAAESQSIDNEELASESQAEQIQSPMLEVLMHLPPNFRSLKNYLGIKPEKLKSAVDSRLKRTPNGRSIVDVRSYEIAQPVPVQSGQKKSNWKRSRREANPGTDAPALEKTVEGDKTVSSLHGSGVVEKYQDAGPGTILPVPDAIRSSMFSTYPVKEFDVVDIDDPDDPRRRRNESVDGRDDKRDKRTFLEEGDGGEATTPLPFWKRKKESPPFITARRESVQKPNAYTPPQHRSADSARESHSLKNLDKTVQSNEINRSNQDNYYSSTNRRTYSRQSDNVASSTPKSVYDTIDYSSKRSQEGGRDGRNFDEKKETLRDGRTHEQYNRQYQYNHPSVYDRSYYHPPYPYPPTEVIGRGVEFYHRTYDPSTGRIIYYANMPEGGRSYDYRFMDPINRNFYLNTRPYYYDPYYRHPVPPYDYRFPSGYSRGMDYMRTGRSSSQAYTYPYSDREKFARDARYNGQFDKVNRPREDFRNKTYIIYDADEGRSQYPRNQFEENRLGFTQNNLPPNGPQVPFRNYPQQVPPQADYFPQGGFPFRNQFYPSSSGPLWGYSQRPGLTDTKLNQRPLNSPEVQLPLTTSNRALHPSAEADKSKKS